MSSFEILKKSIMIIKKNDIKIIKYILIFYLPIHIIDYILSNIGSYQLISVFDAFTGNSKLLIFNVFYLTFAISIFQTNEMQDIKISKTRIFIFLLKVFLPYQVIIVLLKVLPIIISSNFAIPSIALTILSIMSNVFLVFVTFTGFFIITFSSDNVNNIFSAWRKSINGIKKNIDTTIVLFFLLGGSNIVWSFIYSAVIGLLKLNIATTIIGIQNLGYILLISILTIISGYILTMITYCKHILKRNIDIS